MSVHIVGVRHHSPACATVVQAVLQRVRPARVLIEGPVDFNGRIWELGLAHVLPVALFHFVSSDARHVAAFTPFCAHSPEYVAIRWAQTHHADVRFIDLPSWAKAFRHSDNRTADRIDRYSEAMQALCTRLGVDGSDAAWDHLFEQIGDTGELEARLEHYFAQIRPEEEVAERRDLEREDFMARCIAWADTQPGDVVVICGGYHKPALERLWPQLAPMWPELPEMGEGARSGNFVVPWSFERLDAFSGYAAGMPSPGWYDAVHAKGPEDGARQMLEAAIADLRASGLSISAADRIAVEVQLSALASIRGHRVPLRNDVLDALTSGLVKEALDVEPPWRRRSAIVAGTDPRLVQLLYTFRGRRSGRLAPGTPMPPLVASVEAEMALHNLVPTPPPGHSVQLDLHTPGELETSRVLHRLRVLELPGIKRGTGPADPSGAVHEEVWQLVETEAFLPAVLEASAYGASLSHAAERRLQERLVGASDLATLTDVLVDALFVGLDAMADDILLLARHALASTHLFSELARPMVLLLDLWRYDTVFVASGHSSIGEMLQQLLSTALYLFESLVGSDADEATQKAAAALRDLLRDGPVSPGDRVLAEGVFRRRSTDPHAPPDVRGAALGLRVAGGEDIGDTALRTVQHARVEELGDWLAGLFAVTRDTLVDTPSLLDGLHTRVAGLSREEFLVALPSLRLAFAWFPPRERRDVGVSLLGLLGIDRGQALRALRAVDVGSTTTGMELDAEVESLLQTYGQVSLG